MMIKLAELAVAIVALLVAYFTAQSKAVPTGTAARCGTSAIPPGETCSFHMDTQYDIT